MADKIFGDRFLSYREPAWHQLGLVVEDKIPAKEAFDRMGAYKVELIPLGLRETDEKTPPEIDVPYQAIVRHATKDDPEPRIFGIVSADYSLISGWEFCQVWDKHVKAHVETIGALQNGKTMFITTKLPTFAVQGEEIQNYLMATSPMTGGDAAEGRITPVRVVCWNTLLASAALATETYRILHTEGAAERLGSWLGEMYGRALEKSQAVEAAFNIMAKHRLTLKQESRILIAAYRNPRTPVLTEAPKEVIDRRRIGYEKELDYLKGRRTAVRELYRGRGQGSDSKAAAGTAWGLYNAVAELEDYRRGGRGGIESVKANSLFGHRADTKARAFEACLSISQN